MLKKLIASQVFPALVAGLAMGAFCTFETSARASDLGLGTTPTAEEIAAIDIDAMPDGRGLPAGSGTAVQGKEVFAEQCAACHGENLEGIKELGGDRLIGGRDTLGTPKPVKTVESYWPYATTVFDYIKRAMPFTAPGSLSDDEVYAVTAYILNRANIIDEDDEMNADTLARVEMPNKDGFIPDPRPDVRNYR